MPFRTRPLIESHLRPFLCHCIIPIVLGHSICIPCDRSSKSSLKKRLPIEYERRTRAEVTPRARFSQRSP